MHKPVPDPLSYAELVKIARLAKESNTRDWCMIVMAFTHGLRGAEVCGLTLDDIQDDRVRVIRKKGSLPTLHPIMRHVCPELDESKALRVWLAVRKSDTNLLFPSRQQRKPLSTVQFYRIFNGLATDAGIPEVKRHPHILKTTCVSMLVKRDMNLAKVQKFVGHAHITSTQRYIQVTDQEACEAAQSVYRQRVPAFVSLG